MSGIDDKIAVAKAVILRAFSEHDPRKCAVACSFGKDSMAVLHLVRQWHPDILVVFENTGVEYRQTLTFRKRMIREWNLNYVETKPEDGWTFWKCARKYGLPDPVRGKGKHHEPKCCQKLKNGPALKAFRTHGIELAFTGITSAESHQRWMFLNRCSEYYFMKTDEIWKCHPIASWTADEVLEYHHINGIPLNPLYEEFPGVRVGCMPCTAYISWPEVMAKTAPKMYRFIQKMRGQELIDGPYGRE